MAWGYTTLLLSLHLHSAVAKREHLSRFMQVDWQPTSTDVGTFSFDTKGFLSKLNPSSLSIELRKHLESLPIAVSIDDTIFVRVGSALNFEILRDLNSVKIFASSFCKTIDVHPSLIPTIKGTFPFGTMENIVSSSDETFNTMEDCSFINSANIPLEQTLSSLLLAFSNAMKESPVLLEVVQRTNPTNVISIVAFIAFICLLFHCIYLRYFSNAQGLAVFIENGLEIVRSFVENGVLPFERPLREEESLPTATATVGSSVVSVQQMDDGDIENGANNLPFANPVLPLDFQPSEDPNGIL